MATPYEVDPNPDGLVVLLYRKLNVQVISPGLLESVPEKGHEKVLNVPVTKTLPAVAQFVNSKNELLFILEAPHPEDGEVVV